MPIWQRRPGLSTRPVGDLRQRSKGLIAGLSGLSGLWRYRVGDHRILCRMDQGTLVASVVQVGHHCEIYER